MLFPSGYDGKYLENKIEENKRDELQNHVIYQSNKYHIIL